VRNETQNQNEAQTKPPAYTGFKVQTQTQAQTKPPPTPMKLMRKFLNGKTEVLEVGDVVVDIRGKTYYITGWNEFKSTIQATSMCEGHYYVEVPARNFNCYFVEE
jgi:hypothetical protein